jgi:phosphatidylserine decarboxylase
MTAMRALLARAAAHDGLNFLLTNRLIPRRAATRLMGRLSKVEQPLVRDASIGLWRLFCDVDLADAQTTRFRSLHDAFVRGLKPGSRPFDPDPAVLASPCDAIVGACGPLDGVTALQVKGRAYALADLLGDARAAERHRDGTFATLRLTAGMYHRFHAPHDGRVVSARYLAGDAWNVNPPALARVDRLYCRNERAVLGLELAGGRSVTLVPVAAILVSGLRFRFLAEPDPRSLGPEPVALDAGLAKGEEMGWFEHGSTIIVLAPPGVRLAEGVRAGVRIRAGAALMRLPA